MKKKYRAGLVGTAVLASIMAASPVLASGWSQNSQGWWYATSVDGTSWYNNGWQWIDGNGDGIAECYYFDADGYMLANTTTPDGYTVNANGGWVQNGVIQTMAQASATGNTASATKGAATGASTAVTTVTGAAATTTQTTATAQTAASAGTASTVTEASALTTVTSSAAAAASSSGKRGSNIIIANNGTIYKTSSDSSNSDLSDSSSSDSDSSGSGSSGSSSGSKTISSSNYSTSASFDEEKDYSDYAQKCFDLINKKRVANGLDELEWDDTIAEACNVRAEEITEKFSHVRPDSTICFTAFDEVGIACEAEGENIAEGQSTPKLVVKAWMNSKGHRANILKEGFTRSAIGFVYDPDSEYKYYWVQMFGRKRGE